MNVLGIITARGGSKGIPGKNLAPVLGKPLIAWTIDAARASRELKRVILSTDDEAIAQEARARGVDVPFMRPPELSRDETPHIPVLLHALGRLEARGEAFTHVLLLQPTSPLRIAEDIDGAIRLARERGADGVVAVSAVQAHPFWLKTVTDDGRLQDYAARPAGYLARQSLPPVYVPVGSIYLVKREILAERQTFYTDRTYAYVVPPERAVDVDTPWDLRLAEMILKDREARGND